MVSLFNHNDNLLNKPKRATISSAGYDVFSNQEILIKKGETFLYELPFTLKEKAMLCVRSSFGIKKKLRIINEDNKNLSFLIIEPNKNIKVLLKNDNDTDLFISNGEHFLQLVFPTYKCSSFINFEKVSEKESKKNNIVPFAIYDNALYLLEDLKIEENEQILIPTGLKASIEMNTFLAVELNNELNENVILSNGVGIIDADYYNNSNNEGHIFISLKNNSNELVKFTKGYKLINYWTSQFLIDNNEETVLASRQGGIGHSKH